MDERIKGWKYFITSEEEKTSFFDCKATDRYVNEPNQLTALSSCNTDYAVFMAATRDVENRVMQRLKQHGFIHLQTCIVIPNFEEPRWFLPIAKDRRIPIAGKLIKPTKVVSMAAWWVIRFLNIFGKCEVVCRNRIVLSYKKGVKYPNSKFRDFLCGVWGQKKIDFILYTGTYGYNQKFTAQITDEDHQPIAFAKIASSAQTKILLNNEANALILLDKMKFNAISFPRLMALESLGINSDTFLLQSACPNNFQRISRRLDFIHAIAMAELFTKTHKNVQGDFFLSRLPPQPNDAYNFNEQHKNTYELMKQAKEFLYDKLIDKLIPVGLAHGDFTPWNVYTSANKIFLCDWELAANRVPFWDLYNFILHSELLIFKGNAKKLLRLVLNNENAYLKHYQKEILKTKPAYFDKDIFLLIYLCEIVEYYINYRYRNIILGFQVKADVDKILSVTDLLIRELLGRLNK
jgi:thiamine kinase-like enzyme